MTTTVLPELAAESAATADRLVGVSGREGLEPAEAEYILASGLAAIERIGRLWPILKGRIGGGVTGATAQQLLSQLLEALDKNLSLAGIPREPIHIMREELGREPETVAALAAAEERLRQVRAEVVRLLKAVGAPVRWPTAEQLREAKERMQRGERLSADEFRQAMQKE